MSRFLLRHLEDAADLHSTPAVWCETMYEAKARADAVWGLHVDGVCQSIIDAATNQEWSRVCGADPAWRFVGTGNGVDSTAVRGKTRESRADRRACAIPLAAAVAQLSATTPR